MIEDQYIYNGVEFPADYNSIDTFEENNKVCIFVCEIDEDSNTRLSKQGHVNSIMELITYLSRIENEETDHYI